MVGGFGVFTAGRLANNLRDRKIQGAELGLRSRALDINQQRADTGSRAVDVQEGQLKLSQQAKARAAISNAVEKNAAMAGIFRAMADQAQTEESRKDLLAKASQLEEFTVKLAKGAEGFSQNSLKAMFLEGQIEGQKQINAAQSEGQRTVGNQVVDAQGNVVFEGQESTELTRAAISSSGTVRPLTLGEEPNPGEQIVNIPQGMQVSPDGSGFEPIPGADSIGGPGSVVGPLLQKVATSGMNSLTADERTALALGIAAGNPTAQFALSQGGSLADLFGGGIQTKIDLPAEIRTALDQEITDIQAGNRTVDEVIKDLKANETITEEFRKQIIQELLEAIL